MYTSSKNGTRPLASTDPALIGIFIVLPRNVDERADGFAGEAAETDDETADGLLFTLDCLGSPNSARHAHNLIR